MIPKTAIALAAALAFPAQATILHDHPILLTVDRTTCDFPQTTPPGYHRDADFICWVDMILPGTEGTVTGLELDAFVQNSSNTDEALLKLTHNGVSSFWFMPSCPGGLGGCEQWVSLTRTIYNGLDASGPWIFSLGDQDSGDSSRLLDISLRLITTRTVSEPTWLFALALGALAFFRRRT